MFRIRIVEACARMLPGVIENRSSGHVVLLKHKKPRAHIHIYLHTFSHICKCKSMERLIIKMSDWARAHNEHSR